MPNYSVSEAGASIARAYENRPVQEPGPEPAYLQPVDRTPFAYNSWEAMTNVEKFDSLRASIAEVKDQQYRLSNTFERLERLLETHAHAPDGSVMVKYSRNTL